jgi:catechol 2,3-dioxygenase-like lactoylglutathione lyase family enzyme
MKIEHVAWMVREPVRAAQWYVQHLGMKVARSGGAPAFAHFLSDGQGTVLEIYNNPKVAVPDYAAMDLLVLHLAFEVEDVRTVHDRLVRAGATPNGAITVTDTGDEIANLRDPWGFPLQFVKRKERLPA